MNKNTNKLIMFLISLIFVFMIMAQAISFLYTNFDFRGKIYAFMGAVILSSFVMALFVRIATPKSPGKGFSPFELMWIVIFIFALIIAFIEVMYDVVDIMALYTNISDLGNIGLLIFIEISIAVAIPFFLIIVGLFTITLRFISAAASQSVPGILTFIRIELDSAVSSRNDYTRATKKK